jgi:hypothetical protein
MLAVADLTPHVGLSSACQAFSFNRGFVYRDRVRRRVTGSRRVSRARPPLALSITEQDLLLGPLDSARFADVTPAAVFATLLDEARYHDSIRTMYRLLAAQSQSGEHRRQRTHPLYAKPELLAIRPNEVWSWDITQAEGPGQMDLLPSLRHPRHLQPLRSSAGCSRFGSPRNSPGNSSPTPWRRKTSLRVPRRSMPIAAPACGRSPSPRS